MYPLKKKWYEKREPKVPKELRRGWTLTTWKRLEFSMDGSLRDYDEYITVPKNNLPKGMFAPEYEVLATDLTKPEAEALKKLY